MLDSHTAPTYILYIYIIHVWFQDCVYSWTARMETDMCKPEYPETRVPLPYPFVNISPF